MKILAFLGVCLILNTADATLPVPPGFDHHMSLIPGVYKLYWTVKNDVITFQVQVKTSGYVEFGVSPSDVQNGADVVSAWVKNGDVFFQDRYAKQSGLSEAVIDEEQNWSFLEGVEENGFTVLTFSRPLTTCDKTSDLDIKESMKLVFAYHPDDPKDEMSVSSLLNKRKGNKIVTLLPEGFTVAPSVTCGADHVTKATGLFAFIVLFRMFVV